MGSVFAAIMITVTCDSHEIAVSQPVMAYITRELFSHVEVMAKVVVVIMVTAMIVMMVIITMIRTFNKN